MKAVPQEHEFEAARGLPEQLPAGERVLWQGAPRWQTLARHAFHVRLLAVYFAALLAWRAGAAWMDTGSGLTALVSLAMLLPLAALALATLAVLAWLAGRNTVYTITNRRVVMRIGIVLTVTFNLPYRRIESAGLRRHPDGTGDIALVLSEGDQIAYLHLWPHARPWHVRRSQPMLRAVPDCERVSALLAQALTDSTAGEPPVLRAAPARNGRALPASAQDAVPV
ncbi:MAG: photosynthetic complex putative assembly protein PuhB [Rhodoferax sp.]